MSLLTGCGAWMLAGVGLPEGADVIVVNDEQILLGRIPPGKRPLGGTAEVLMAEHCRVCAEACRRCEQVCERLLAA